MCLFYSYKLCYCPSARNDLTWIDLGLLELERGRLENGYCLVLWLSWLGWVPEPGRWDISIGDWTQFTTSFGRDSIVMLGAIKLSLFFYHIWVKNQITSQNLGFCHSYQEMVMKSLKNRYFWIFLLGPEKMLNWIMKFCEILFLQYFFFKYTWFISR